jgi:hypothetical protein
MCLGIDPYSVHDCWKSVNDMMKKCATVEFVERKVKINRQ